jgi:ubiquitin carboxyl-terminal hydrolase 36/42
MSIQRFKGISNNGSSCYANSIIQCLAYTWEHINFIAPLAVIQTDKQKHLELLRKIICEHQRKGVNKSRVQELLKPFFKKAIFSKGAQEDASELLFNLLNLIENKESFEIEMLIQKSCNTFSKHKLSDIPAIESLLTIPVQFLENKSLETYLHDMISVTDGMDCAECGEVKSVFERKIFLRLPPILIINLSRTGQLLDGKTYKRRDFIHVPFEMNLLTSTAGKPPSCVSYRLYAVTLHRGDLNSGHYTSKKIHFDIK